MFSDEMQAAIVQKFRRRFAFAMTVIFAGIIAFALFHIAFEHSLNAVRNWQGRLMPIGYARPDLLYAGSLVTGLIFLHGVWLLWRERWLNRQKALLAAHGVLAAVSFALIYFFFSSWFINEGYKGIEGYVPASLGPPSEGVTYLLGVLLLIVIVSFPSHVLYRALLAFMLRRSRHESKPKIKRDELASLVGDDGELADWAAQEMKAKRLS